MLFISKFCFLVAMTIVSLTTASFDAKGMLEAPRRSSVSSNFQGDLGVFVESNYSFANHSFSSGIYLVNSSIKNHQELLVPGRGAKSPRWITNHSFLYVKDNSASGSSIVVFDVDHRSESVLYDHDVLISELSVVKDSNRYRVIFTSLDSSGRYEPLTQPNVHVYDSLFVRHWDHWKTGERNSLYSIILEHHSEIAHTFQLTTPTAIDLLQGTGLECPIEPFGDSTDFDATFNELVFVAKDPKSNPATQTRTVVYLLNLTTMKLKSLSAAMGACSSPIISEDGSKIGWLEMRTPQYESDQNQVMIYYPKNGKKQHVAQDWDRSPASIHWGTLPSGETGLYAIADDEGRRNLFFISTENNQVISLTKDESVLSVSSSEGPKLWLSKSSFISPKYFVLYDPSTKEEEPLLDANLGLSKSSYEEVWYPGTNGHKIHGWIVRPESFDATKRYPLAIFIHGGPQGSWTDSWSTRWNPAVFANSGFIVFTIDPVGSTGYGQQFTDDIALNWGGRPYHDIVRGVDYITGQIPYVDGSRMVALGASYGGYMINWIQGHPLGNRFRALVSHDGVFNTVNTFYSTDELYFPMHDFGGTPWENRATYERWNPSNFVENWATPQLVIHSSKDYRLTESEGISTFNALQYKKIPSKLLVFEDENHWVLKPENSLRWHHEVLSWITQHVNDN
ncbi:serine protease [Schizosaccharomyces cryophilus OY26]|uniref:Dipeptidyl-peptidase V n=1 Tax=Schizosaccharomyces cryophilus (strain OY26 / ATCC MYA-4695 / CBS 11777 / NBRC 106824 / NRRL Y48691) TaxID=653667 RepID=S9WXU9_SCHCR|nr:serine protease [Schizosaccharomyces cryophilus OY26]EPY49542.1 serine protease [Schizosaccharomyces cryophilus OY26]